MKKLIVILILLCLVLGAAVGEGFIFSVGVDWQLGIQGGIEYHFNDYLGVKTDLGISPLGLVMCDLYAIVETTIVDNPWHMKVLVGIPNLAAPLTFEAAMLTFGGAVELHRDLSDSLSLGLRAGAGFPLFFEEDTDIIRDIQFPFDLWPEFGLFMNFR